MIVDIIIIIVLLVVAIALLILELFFLPGLSVAGFMSVLFYGVALYYAFVNLGITAGVIALVSALLLSIFLIWYFMRSKTLDRISLHTDIDGTATTVVSSAINVGDVGVTISRLNPMGRVKVGNEIVEARTLEFLEEGTEVRVMKIETTVIVVEPIVKI